MKSIHNKIVLITGGTGSWGSELTSQLLGLEKGPKEIRIYSRNEHKQVQMRLEYPSSKVKFIIGDVRDKNILHFAMTGVNTVFHLAALKHVPVCEDNPWEAILTNIYGTQNVIETAIANNVEVVVDVSTDKAVEPYNLYGVTKSCAEKLVINANRISKQTKFVCIRGGNVIGTNGSVIPLFKKQIQKSNTVTVTDRTMTRFLFSTKGAIKLIFEALKHHKGGEIFVLRMPSASVLTIVEAMIYLFGNSETKILDIGPRHGEKMHEVLISRHEIARTEICSNEYFTIHSQNKKIISSKKLSLSEFTSENTKRLTTKELIQILKSEKWLFK